MVAEITLAPKLQTQLETLQQADLVVGIPSFNNVRTIPHVVRAVQVGLAKFFPGVRAVIVNSDGGSTDGTQQAVQEASLEEYRPLLAAHPVYPIHRIVTPYHGIPGKGSALRTVFQVAAALNAKACAVVDSDLRSIEPAWMDLLLSPQLHEGFDFVAPLYLRHKYDGTITNNIVYNLTRSLYGKRIRQPIGGDFAFTAEVAAHFLSQPVWDTEIARFGIDIWMTVEAIIGNFKITQANLGVKIHDAKDPATHLAPMFRQVVWTFFHLMEQHESYWMKVKESQPLEVLGACAMGEPEPIKVDLEALVYKFRVGFKQFGVFWKDILDSGSYSVLRKASKMETHNFSLPIEAWVKILYELAATFHYWPINRNKLIDLMTPLYHARVASFVRESWDMDSNAAEALVEKQAEAFEANKKYLIDLWQKKRRILQRLSEKL